MLTCSRQTSIYCLWPWRDNAFPARPDVMATLLRTLHFIAAIGSILAAGAIGSVAQEHYSVPTVDVASPNFAYPSEPCTLTLDHFRNMRAYIWKGRRILDSGELRRGEYEKSDPTGGGSGVELAWVRFPRNSNANPDIAVALYRWEWVGGSSSQSDVVQVFECKRDHLLVLQQISNDAHSEHAGVNYDPRTGILTVKSVRYGAGAHCCPEKLDIVRFRWTGTEFKQFRWKTIPMPK